MWNNIKNLRMANDDANKPHKIHNFNKNILILLMIFRVEKWNDLMKKIHFIATEMKWKCEKLSTQKYWKNHSPPIETSKWAKRRE